MARRSAIRSKRSWRVVRSPRSVVSGQLSSVVCDSKHLARTTDHGLRTTDYSLFLFIKLATNPAPKPLSIFTTVTFEAHELSIASNAASPSNEAP